MGENSLHEAVKKWYAQPGDLIETWVDGYLVDIVRRGKLIEVQTSNFSAIKSKIKDLIERHHVTIVHPVVEKKWIVRLNSQEKQVSRRRSPRRGRVEDLFLELVYLPTLLISPNFSLEVVLVHAEEVLIDDGRGSWRRKYWSIHDRRLLKILNQVTFKDPYDLQQLLPQDIPEKFTTRDIAQSLGVTLNIARKMCYTLRLISIIEVIGKRGRANLYTIP
jgi:hypothetical protein